MVIDLKIAVRNNFSRCSATYDNLSQIQQATAGELISMLEERSFGSILEIGCGTGAYTKLLTERYPESNITAIDISAQMLKVAASKLTGRRVAFKECDGEFFDKKTQFDLVTSNAAFQWYEDLSRALICYKDMLNGGMILFSIFGPNTFKELSVSIKSVFGNGAHLPSERFTDKKELINTMAAVYKNIKIDEQIFVKEYPSIISLLSSIRESGTRGDGIQRGLWTKSALGRIEDAYIKAFGSIRATYEVFFIRGEV